jgi:hypothetical protein
MSHHHRLESVNTVPRNPVYTYPTAPWRAPFQTYSPTSPSTQWFATSLTELGAVRAPSFPSTNVTAGALDDRFLGSFEKFTLSGPKPDAEPFKPGDIAPYVALPKSPVPVVGEGGPMVIGSTRDGSPGTLVSAGGPVGTPRPNGETEAEAEADEVSIEKGVLSPVTGGLPVRNKAC